MFSGRFASRSPRLLAANASNPAFANASRGAFSRLCLTTALLVALASLFGSAALAQTVTYPGIEVPVAVNQTIQPEGITLDQAGNLIFYDGVSSKILKVPIGGGTPVALASQVAGPAVAWDSTGSSGNGALLYINGVTPNQYFLADEDDLSGALQPPNFVAGPEWSNATVVSAPLTSGTIMAVWAESSGQLQFATRSSGTWSAPSAISGAITPGGLTMALIPDQEGGAVLIFEGPDYKYYWVEFSLATWSSTPSAVSSPTDIGNPSGAAGTIGMAFDAGGDLFVTDQNNSTIQEYPWTGTSYIGYGAQLYYGSPVTLPAELSGPTGVVADTLGDIFVSDTGNNRIVKLTQTANFGSVAIGTTSSALPLTFNITSGVVGSISVQTVGVPNKDFAIAAGTTCTALTYSLPTSCLVDVTFTPSAAGLRRGAVVFYSGANNTGTVLGSFAVFGTGSGPELAYGPGTPAAIIPTVNSLALSLPGGVAVGPSALYIADMGNSRVIEVPANQNPPIAIAPVVNSLSLKHPSYVTLDGAGNLFISDTGNNRVVEVPANGSAAIAISPTINSSGLATPLGIVVDGAGNLYIADGTNNRVVEVPAGGGAAFAIEPTANGEGVFSPQGLAVDGAGDLFIVDGNNRRVVEVPAGGGAAIAIIPELEGNQALSEPAGIAVDGAGDLYIADIEDNRVLEVPAGGGTPIIVDPTVSSLALNTPIGVAVDSVGDLFVGDEFNNRVVGLARSLAPELSFPTVTTVDTSDTTDGTITAQVLNVGNQPLTLTALTYPIDFPMAGGDTNPCTSSTTLSAGQQCDLPVEFSPLSVGQLSESISLTDNTLNVPGTQQRVGVTGSSSVPDGATHFSVAAATNESAGASFSITVTALGNTNQTITAYNGTVQFTSSDPKFVNPGALTLSSGTGQTTVTLKTAAAQTITATDASTSTLTGTGSFAVQPGPANSLAIGNVPATATSGTAFDVTVTAYDLFLNIATGYTGMVQFTSSDPYAKLPPAASPLTAGTGSFFATLETPGAQTITASDPINSLSNTSGGIFVTAPGYVVTTNVDDSTGFASNCPAGGGGTSCSLRDALAAANATGAGNVTFSSAEFNSGNSLAQNTITLGLGGTLSIPANTVILGPTSGSGATLKNLVTVSGESLYSVLSVAPGVTGASLSDLTISGGSSGAGYGGGIDNNGSLTVSGSTISGNTAAFSGGGIFNQTGGSLKLIGSTVSGNQATGIGGGIYNNGSLTLTNSTISGNSASEFGGGVYTDGTLISINSTVSANTATIAGGGIVFGASAANLANTIVSGNSAEVDADVVGNYGSNGGNQVSLGAINLGPLANNGGPTKTMTPMPASAAICGGTTANAAGLSTDQRGFPRTKVYGSTTCVDSGALQTNYAITFTTQPPASGVAGTALSPPPVVTLTESGAVASAATTSVVASGSPVTLAGTTSAALSSGLASFSNLIVPSGATAETLTATLALNASLSLTAQAGVAVLVRAPALLTTPAPGSKLASTSVTFSWTPGTGITNYWLNLGTGSSGTAAKNIYAGSSITATSLNVTGLPNNAELLYATLYSYINGSWVPTVYTYSASGSGPAVLLTPIAGAKLNASTTFTWSTGGEVTAYWLNLGTTASGANAKNIYSSGPVSVLSETVTGIPTYGGAIYATLYSEISGVYEPTVYTFTATGSPVAAVLTTPTPSSKLSSSSVTFSWSPGGGVANYWLNVGTGNTGLNAKSLYSGASTTATSVAVTGLPTNGETIYATLYSYIAGAWQPTVYTYTASGSPTPAAMTTPQAGSTLTSSSVTFTWSRGSGVTYYWLTLGTGSSGAAAKNLYAGGSTSATSVTVGGLPTNGVTIYATLYSYISGAWQPTVYTYTAQ